MIFLSVSLRIRVSCTELEIKDFFDLVHILSGDFCLQLTEIAITILITIAKNSKVGKPVQKESFDRFTNSEFASPCYQGLITSKNVTKTLNLVISNM